MTELFFARRIEGVFAILTARLGPDGWTHPERLELFPDDRSVGAVDMALSPDARALYFLGIVPGATEGEADRRDIWVSDRTAEGWSPARLVPAPVSTEHGESYPVLTDDGSLWFLSDRPESRGPRDLYRARPAAGGGFATPVSIDPPINTDARKGDTLVAPDETYIASEAPTSCSSPASTCPRGSSGSLVRRATSRIDLSGRWRWREPFRWYARRDPSPRPPVWERDKAECS